MQTNISLQMNKIKKYKKLDFKNLELPFLLFVVEDHRLSQRCRKSLSVQ